MNVENRYVTIKHPIEGKPLMSDFEVRTEQLTLEIQKGSKDVIVKNIFVSIDPYQLNRMKAESDSQKASILSSRISPGQKIDAHGLGRVVESGNDKWKKGDLITGLLGWEEYSLVKPWTEPNRIEAVDQFPLSCHLSVLGTSGLTAYAGLFHICKPKKGDKVFVSAGAGSVGNLVGQYAKLAGCYVVGCAGSKKKVDLLKEKLGFDDVFNYKEEPDLKSALRRYFPDGIDIYFDNVGGEMLEVAIANMNAFGRVAACGAISEYTDKKKQARIDMMDVIYKRITISGYLVSDYVHVYPDFVSMTSEHLSHGRMHAVEDISHGIENVPSALVELFEGVNIGKKLVQVDLLKEKLGFDDVFNYKEEPDLKSALRRYFPDGIDIYFDNVGGEMLEVAIANMNAFGRVAACGAISEYTDKKKQARIDMMDVIYKRITISGYLVSDYVHVYPDFVSMTSEHLSHGRMHAVEDISHGIENVPLALVELFEGVNIGKKLVQVSEI
ncbi:hypothetical protein IEQ34_021893 [Dendrobium chrysotoxum]|uniref:Enoyl reductase (ER) domain-containing protein n=1 Tax=Dendrobium chrysotoxum TaxID=161865 RepID=A0AAV7FX88_DENCH|nr:hypothetical protein IEQ34_021893 [Dendrobium chrysotoxum]